MRREGEAPGARLRADDVSVAAGGVVAAPFAVTPARRGDTGDDAACDVGGLGWDGPRRPLAGVLRDRADGGGE